MEKRLFRLAMSITLVSFLGFSGCALYYQYQYNSWTRLLANYPTYADQSFRECGDLPTPEFVRTGECPPRQDGTGEPFEMPQRFMKGLHASVWAAVIVPLLILGLFYARLGAAALRARRAPVTTGEAVPAGSMAILLKTHASIELIAMIENVMPGAFDRAERIRNVRTQINTAVDNGSITVAESRVLMKQTVRLEHGFDADA